MQEYINALNEQPQHKILKQMDTYAKANKIPIIGEAGLTMLLMLFDLHRPKTFLEIGTAIGYCSVNLALYNEEVIIDTIEKNNDIYIKALEYVHDAGLADRITVHYGDALDYDLKQLAPSYDIIFIDAAKAQYTNFFEIYKQRLAPGGIIVTDNLLFHGLVLKTAKIISKDLRHLTAKISKFNQWLARNKEFRTSFFAVGDGMSISRRIEE